jgi:hypothetical protein
MRTLTAFLFAATVAGCTGTGSVQYSGQATVVTPTMVEVEPGVQVVEDYDQPVFYSDGLYWRYEGGVWYRSNYFDRAYVRVYNVPVAVQRIQRPERYVHYRVRGDVRADVRRDPARDRYEVREERRENNREVEHDRGELRHDQNELNHDRAEIRADQRRGDEREEARDRKELQKDQREQRKDRKELEKDQRKRH